MMEFLAENWIWLAIALLIGLLTAWWAWAKPGADSHDNNAGMASGLINSATDTVTKTASGAVNVTKKAADTSLSTAKSGIEKTQSAATSTAKKTRSTAQKAASATKKTAKAASGAPKTAKKTAATAKKATVAAASKTKSTAKTAASTTKKSATKAASTVKKTAAKAAPKAAAAKPATKKPAAKKPAAKKATPTVIPNDLELLKGVGPKLNGLLKSLGVTSFDQIANWKAADVRDVDSKLGSFAGRISRDNWVDQAKLLSKGDVKGFEKKYGSLGSEIKR